MELHKASVISKQKELILLYMKYIELLEDELHETISIATQHGWSSKKYNEGENYRNKIFDLTMEIDWILS